MLRKGECEERVKPPRAATAVARPSRPWPSAPSSSTRRHRSDNPPRPRTVREARERPRARTGGGYVNDKPQMHASSNRSERIERNAPAPHTHRLYRRISQSPRPASPTRDRPAGFSNLETRPRPRSENLGEPLMMAPDRRAKRRPSTHSCGMHFCGYRRIRVAGESRLAWAARYTK
ncbi:hypothetical protein C8Q79DRAFT_399147 [Trametes meyenii]|nr:hypothetical protein C8Q79DRAFT_399147 [Trametes meyenii]